jgi:hypothetical protein
VRVACALYVLERVFVMVTYRPLLHNLLLALFSRSYRDAGGGGGSAGVGVGVGPRAHQPCGIERITASAAVATSVAPALPPLPCCRDGVAATLSHGEFI